MHLLLKSFGYARPTSNPSRHVRQATWMWRLSQLLPLSVTDSGGSFNVKLMNMSFVFLVLTCIPISEDWWTSSSVNNGIHLMCDLFKISVIVVSSMNLCVKQIGWSASISMTNVSGPRYDQRQPFAPSWTLCLQSLPANTDVRERSTSNRWWHPAGPVHTS